MTSLELARTAVRRMRASAFFRPALAYLAMVVIPLVIAYTIIKGAGHHHTASTGHAAPDLMYGLLRALVVIILLAQLLGGLCERLGQPRLVGEMIAGLLLGPSFLGALIPSLEHGLFGPSVLPILNVLAQLGVIFFMFIVGLELPLPLLRRSGSAAVVIGHGTIATPFLVGAVLALAPLRGLRPPGSSIVSYVLFVGLAFAITALPVLARILEEHRLAGTRIGTLGLASAGIGDVTAWCLLVFVVAVARGGSYMPVLRTVCLAVVFAAVMLWAVRPAAERLLRLATEREWSRAPVLALTLAAVFTSAYAADLIGVHVIFGAFIAGLVAPRSCPPVADLADKLGDVTSWCLLPLFFAYIGLRARLWTIGSVAGWLTVALIIVAAVASKFVGTVCSARLAGVGRRDTMSLAIMMNCRGLTELVVLDVGLSYGVIGSRLFTMLVVMALVTTVGSGLALGLVHRPEKSPERVPDPVGSHAP